MAADKLIETRTIQVPVFGAIEIQIREELKLGCHTETEFRAYCYYQGREVFLSGGCDNKDELMANTIEYMNEKARKEAQYGR